MIFDNKVVLGLKQDLTLKNFIFSFKIRKKAIFIFSVLNEIRNARNEVKENILN